MYEEEKNGHDDGIHYNIREPLSQEAGLQWNQTEYTGNPAVAGGIEKRVQ